MKQEQHIFFVNGNVKELNYQVLEDIKRRTDLVVSTIECEINPDEVIVMTNGEPPIWNFLQSYKRLLNSSGITVINEQYYSNDDSLLQNLLEKDSGTIIVLLVKEEKSIPNKYLKELRIDSEEDLFKDIPKGSALRLSFTPKPKTTKIGW